MLSLEAFLSALSLIHSILSLDATQSQDGHATIKDRIKMK